MVLPVGKNLRWIVPRWIAHACILNHVCGAPKAVALALRRNAGLWEHILRLIVGTTDAQIA